MLRLCSETCYAQRPAQQLRQQRVARGGEGAGSVKIGVDAVEHRRNLPCEGGGDGLGRQNDFESADVAPVGARHLGAGRGEVGELNQGVASRVAEG